MVAKGVVDMLKRVAGAGEGTSTTSRKTFKQALGFEKGKAAGTAEEKPCLVVQPSEELLDILKRSFVAELFQDFGAMELQQRLVMEDLAVVKVTRMGEKRKLLQVDGNKDLE